MNPSPEYVPGTCNIGPAEIKARRKAAVFSLVLSIAVILLLLLVDANRIWRLILFIPVASLVVGFQQTYFKFCVGFGMKGLFNFGDLGKNDTIEQAEFRQKDRKKALQMIVTGIVAGLIVAILFYLLPF